MEHEILNFKTKKHNFGYFEFPENLITVTHLKKYTGNFGFPENLIKVTHLCRIDTFLTKFLHFKSFSSFLKYKYSPKLISNTVKHV